MIGVVLQKMRSNGWLTLCLLLGSVLAASFAASIPLYTQGALQRLLIDDLEQFQRDRNRYPGHLAATASVYRLPEGESKREHYAFFDEYLTAEVIPTLGLPVQAETVVLTSNYLSLHRTDRPDSDERRRTARIRAQSGFEERVELVHGRLPDPSSERLETVVSEAAMHHYGLIFGETYTFTSFVGERVIAAEMDIVGIFTFADFADVYWHASLHTYRDTFMIPFESFQERFVETEHFNFSEVMWYYALDYRAIDAEDTGRLAALSSEYERLGRAFRMQWEFPIFGILEQYNERATHLRLTLSFIQTPILLMLVFFIYMVSQLVVERDRAEIAAMKSRGASGGQIFRMYLFIGLILAGIAAVLGPVIGLFICQVIGSAGGFLEFVRRRPLPVTFSIRAFVYSAIGSALFVVTMLIPAVGATRTTIVHQKQTAGSVGRPPFWRRGFFDVVLLAISMYGYYVYRTQDEIIRLTDVSGASLPLDPLLFVISVAFILGAGLLSMRLFPLLVAMLFRVGRERWPAPAYASLLHVGRSGGNEQFLMVFLILSLGLGVYNSVAARTVNQNSQERVTYRAGADIVLQAHWPSDAPPDGSSGEGMGPAGPSPTFPTGRPERVIYREPPFQQFHDLPGVEAMTRVFRRSTISLTLPNRSLVPSDLIAIIPDEFGAVATMRPTLLPPHWFHYLNLLAERPDAVLLSRSVAENADVRLGDIVYFSWGGQRPVGAYVYGFIDYWPTYNPFDRVAGRPRHFIVANLQYLHNTTTIEPYDVWIRKETAGSGTEIVNALEDRRISLTRYSDTDAEITQLRNDPILQGTNGTLSLGFLVTMAVSALGFVIYWVVSLSRRTLQFGVLRAMGLSRTEVTVMLLIEQILITGTAVVLGIAIGNIAAILYVPLLQLTATAAEQVPPFRIVFAAVDYIRIYTIAGALIVFGVVLFRSVVRSVRIHQAVKIGEE